MTGTERTARLAGLEDMEGIRALLRKYHRDTISDEDRPDGFVTTAITDDQLTELIGKERGVTVIAEPVEGEILFCRAMGILVILAAFQTYERNHS